MKQHNAERGSVIVYILIAIFLTGLLVATMTTGAKKSATSQQLDEAVLYLQADIKTLQSAVTECVMSYPKPVDVDGNGTADAADDPNQPFPLYCADGACAQATMTGGGSGADITSVGCPGAPNGQRPLFSSGAFKLLGDTSKYNATFLTDATEGVYLRITRAVSDPLWTEAIARLDEKYSKCTAAAVTDNPDPLGFDCSGGCFYYWILRQPTSATSFEATCP